VELKRDAPRARKSDDPNEAMPDVSAIRAHLEVLYNSPQFRQSKRCQALLRFVVEETLEGRGEHLKERVVGAQAFGREPSYETTHDPIVRNAAIEVRKRLAQYYQENGSTPEVRIQLPPGSYVPEFKVESPVPAEEVFELTPELVADSPPPSRRRSHWIVPAGVACLSLLAFAGWRWTSRQTAFDKLWAPFMQGPLVQVCVGEPRRLIRIDGPSAPALYESLRKLKTDPPSGRTLPLGPQDFSATENRYIHRRDALAVARVAAMLASKGIPHRLRTDSDAPYSELKGSPLIALGGFDPRHRMKLRQGFRFELTSEIVDSVRYSYVLDRENPERKDWRFPVSDMKSLGPADYALVTLTMLSATEKAAIAIVGLTDFSTLAAGEFVTDPDAVNAAFRNVPAGWEKKNLQIVLETKVIQDVPGQTKAVAIHAW
jgi:hypothetical protein